MIRNGKRVWVTDVEFTCEELKLPNEWCDGYITGVLDSVGESISWYDRLNDPRTEPTYLRYFVECTREEYERAVKLIRNRYETYPTIMFDDMLEE